MDSQNEKFEILSHYGINGVDFSDGILKEHNKDTYAKILQGFAKGNKVLVEQATGTGKTFLAMKYIHDYASNGQRILFVSPTHVIENAFLDNCKECLSKATSGQAQFNISTALYAGLNKEVNNKYDLIILDEVHRAGAPKWSEYAEKLIENNPDARVLGLTATLERTDGVDVKRLFDNQEPISRLNIVDAIRNGILPTPDYTLSKIDFGKDLEFIEQNLRELMEKMNNATPKERAFIVHYLADLNIAQKMIAEREEITDIFARELNTPKLKNGKFIVFCEPGERENENGTRLILEHLAKQAPEWFSKVDGAPKVKPYLVHSLYGNKHNATEIVKFEKDNSDGIKLLFSVNMLNEGKHVDDIDGVIMFRPTQSHLIYLQQLGRALSVGNSEHPKIFDFVANLTYANIREIATLLSFDNSSLSTTKVNVDGGKIENIANLKNIAFNLNIVNLEYLEFIEAIKKNIYNFNRNYDFENFYNHLVLYKEDSNNLDIPADYIMPDGYFLGKKVQTVRQIEKGTLKGARLTEKQKDELNKLGFIWDAKSFDFETFFRHFIAYKNENKSADIPVRYVSPDGYQLGQKINYIRLGHNENSNKGAVLTREQISLLDENGFIWKKKDNLDINKFVLEVENFVCEFGHANIKQTFVTDDGYPLGRRTGQVRQLYNNSSKIITEDTLKRLEKCGFVWDATRKFPYEQTIKELKEYKEEYGNLLVKRSYISPSGFKLGIMTSRLRLMKKGKTTTRPLTQEQIYELTELGFVWDARKSKPAVKEKETDTVMKSSQEVGESKENNNLREVAERGERQKE